MTSKFFRFYYYVLFPSAIDRRYCCGFYSKNDVINCSALMLLWQTRHPTKTPRQLRMDDLDTRRTAVLLGTPERVVDTVRYAAANHGEML